MSPPSEEHPLRAVIRQKYAALADVEPAEVRILCNPGHARVTEDPDDFEAGVHIHLDDLPPDDEVYAHLCEALDHMAVSALQSALSALTLRKVTEEEVGSVLAEVLGAKA